MKQLMLSVLMVMVLSSFAKPGILPKIQKVQNQSVLIVPTEKVVVLIFDEDNHQIHNEVIKKPTKFNLTYLADGKYKIIVKSTNNTVIDEQEVVLKTETKRILN